MRQTKKEIETAAEEYAEEIRKAEHGRKIFVEDPKEIYKDIIGEQLLIFEILTDPEQEGSGAGEAYCADEEIYMEFASGKEMRIYIDEEGKLVVYTD
jgi:hypothetical protein